MASINVFTAENTEGRIDVAGALGSAGMAMFVYDLAPGAGASPYHYEYEEEWLLVLDGTVVVRVPDGERTLERGGLVCFPAGPAGAHKVMNRSALRRDCCCSRARGRRPSRSTRTATRSGSGRGTRRTI